MRNARQVSVEQNSAKDRIHAAIGPATITEDMIRAYLKTLDEKEILEETRKQYKERLWKFYRSLPQDKRIGSTTLAEWRDKLKGRYTPATINTCISIVNWFLEWLGRRDLQLLDRLEQVPLREEQPELSRGEYHRLLYAAIRQKDEQSYLLVKTFATTGISVHGLAQLTVDAVRSGIVHEVSSGVEQVVRIPPSLQSELLSYASEQGIWSGPLFQSRNGKALNRSNVNVKIRDLCPHAHVKEEKANPRALKKLYMAARRDVESRVTPLLDQAYDNLLEMEESAIGWPKES